MNTNDYVTSDARSLFDDFVPVAVESGSAGAAEGPAAPAGADEPEPDWHPL